MGCNYSPLVKGICVISILAESGVLERKKSQFTGRTENGGATVMTTVTIMIITTANRTSRRLNILF